MGLLGNNKLRCVPDTDRHAFVLFQVIPGSARAAARLNTGSEDCEALMSTNFPANDRHASAFEIWLPSRT